MKTTFFNPYVSGHAIKAICWTFIHSLWIGIIAAALAGLVIATTRKATANLRYRLLCGIMMLFVIATTFTFFTELQKPVHNDTLITLSSNATGQTVISITNADVTIDGFNYTRVVYFLDQYAAWIFAAWLICFAFKSVKLTRELLYTKRVRSMSVADIGVEWKRKVFALAVKLGINRFVDVKESKLISVPVTIGYLKPIILLPAGMIMQLSPGQIESVLYHELAHILRRDYLVNILQSVVETVFFFNPAIWWISTLIREERETCCDDIVLAHVPQKRNYLEALMAFESYQSDKGGYAMALSLRKNQLMNRLRRMVNNENQKLNAAEKVVLLAGMVLLSMFVFVPKAQSEVKHGVNLITKQVMTVVNHLTRHNVPPPPPSIQIKKSSPPPKPVKLKIDTLQTTVAIQQLTDTLPKLVRIQFEKTNADSLNREVTVTDDINNIYYLHTVNGKLVGFSINGVKIPEAEYSHYKPLISRVNKAIAKARIDKDKLVKGQVQLLIDKHNSEIAMIDARKKKREIHDAIMLEKDKERSEKDKAYDAKMNQKDKVQHEKDKVQHEKDKVRHQKDKERHDQENERDEKAHGNRGKVLIDEQGNRIELDNEGNINMVSLHDGKTTDSLKISRAMARERAEVEKHRLDDRKSRSRDSVRAKKVHHVDISDQQNRVRGVIAALVNEKVVSNAAGVDWFGLSNDELIVNGNKQPEALHQKLKEQYHIQPNNGLYYGPVKMTGTGVFLDKKDL